MTEWPQDRLVFEAFCHFDKSRDDTVSMNHYYLVSLTSASSVIKSAVPSPRK